MLAIMSWGHGAVQRALLTELQKQRRLIDTISLLRIRREAEEDWGKDRRR
jgi:hypothetical protein